MRKLISPLLPRLTAVAATFAVALAVTYAWRLLPVFSSSPPRESSQRLVGVLTPAIIEEPMGPAGLVEKDGAFWIVRRGRAVAEFDVQRPIAVPPRDANLITTGCATLTVAVDETRKLTLNTDAMGSLDEPSRLKTTLAELFRERALHRAYSPGMEDRAELPLHERIEKTVLITASASLPYGEVLELLSIVEEAGAAPVVLRVGASDKFFDLPTETAPYE